MSELQVGQGRRLSDLDVSDGVTATAPESRNRCLRSAMSACVGLALVMATSACTTGRPPELPMILQWPDPPDPARIEYVSIIRGPRDLTGPPTFGDKFSDLIGLDSKREKSIVQPSDIEVSANGSIVYVSDFAQGLIHIFDREKKETRYLGLEKPLSRPFGMALDDSAGKLYVAEQEAGQIRVLSLSGETLSFIRSDKLIRPVDIVLDATRGRLYVADGSHQNSTEHYVRMFDLEGKYLGEVGGGRGTAEGYLLFPTYLALDDAGNLYVSDTMNSRISVFDPDGHFLRTIGRRGDGFGLFDKPKGIALDSFGNVYVVDSSWSNVQIFGPQGDVLLFFGGRGGYPGLLRNPTGIAIAKDTNTIFVGDYLNRRIDIYQLKNTKEGEGVPEQTE